MYRELASLDAFGVPGGPYTGAPRTFRFRDLPDAVRSRLGRCLSREELPTPLLAVSTGRPRRFALSLAAAIVAALPWAWAATLPRASIVPAVFAAVCIAPYAVAGWLAQRALRKDQLQAGVYLFPLDIVEAEGDTIRVTPLGSLRNAGIRRDEGQLWLELRFDHGASYRFGCPDDASAERACAKICEAHVAVERITFGRDLEETVDLDPFFAIRGEPVWAAATSLRARSVVVRNARGVLAGAFTGALVFAAVAARGDHALYRDAVATSGVDGYQHYLDAGGRLHREQAGWALHAMREAEAQHRDFVERERAAKAKLPDEHVPDSFLTPEQRTERLAQQAAALSRYEALVHESSVSGRWGRHLDVARILRAVFERARESTDNAIYFDFVRRREEVPDALAPLVRASVDARESRLLQAFAQVLSQTVPTSLVRVRRLSEVDASAPRILVVEVGETLVARNAASIDIEFDVVPREQGTPDASRFHLRMPAPKTKPELRARSLFQEPAAFGAELDVALVTARAFDRLYDETYGLFFSGDPVVPIARQELP